MPDIREQTLLDQMDASRYAIMRSNPLRARIRLAVRRFVVATSVPPLSYLYKAIYRLHLWYALRVLRRFPGVHSIYVTGGLSSDEIRPGISDIDMIVNGDWTDEEQMKVAYAMRRLSALSPLYDAQLGGNAHTLSSLVTMYETDYFFQFRLNLGRSRWKRLYGEDLFALLPPLSEEKIAGGYYSEIRLWWEQFVDSAFGSGVTASDALFRNSISYKTVVGIQKMDLALRGKAVSASRKEVIAQVLEETGSEEDRSFLTRLERSAERRHLRFEGADGGPDGDVHEESFAYLMRLMERIHKHLGEAATFQTVPGEVLIDAVPGEMMVADSSRIYVTELVTYLKREWQGYRSASMVPSLSFFYPDDLPFLIEVDPAQIPTVRQIKALCAMHATARQLPQRVALFLQLPYGAYQLEILSSAEFWHHTLCAVANPEMYSLLGKAEFVVDGVSQHTAAAPSWTRFAAAQLLEEITVRRAAFSKAAEGAASLSSLDLLRNLWRQVQLEIVVRSSESGQILVPLTVPAMLRTLRSWGLPEDSIFSRLAAAYDSEMAGSKVDVHAMMPEVMELLVLFQ
ncbi:MAG TPA: hypothetical protein VGD59_04810 [Acidisarcina sp.]